MNITRAQDRNGQRGSEEWFTGQVWSEEIAEASTRLRAHLVTFSPKARTAWHTHPLGQALEVVSGRARIGLPNRAVEVLSTGDVVWFDPDEWHWHGAAADGPMVHLALQEAADDGTEAAWGDHVTDDEYDR
jgi:quercetin dioxygenase-like cupin family protein